MDRNEAVQCFTDARKQAVREYKRRVSNGQNGYLPFLDDILKNVEFVSEADLGIVEIPLNKIVGTYTKARSLSFANNFMPIIGRLSEFGEKWIKLCETHMNEGIRDPIKAYEYLNWFYVVEGNKRVSVLKYFDAHSITGRVTRLIPKKDDNDINIKIYYEFLEFYKKTKINNIWFSREGSFKALENLLDHFEASDIFGSSKYRHFSHSVFLSFRRAFHEAGGGKLPITTGDAFLEYAKLYDMPSETDEAVLKSRLNELMPELEGLVKQDGMEIHTQPFPIYQNKIFSAITTLVKPGRKLKVAFAYAKNAQKSNWTFSHEMGRMHLEKLLSDQVQTSYITDVPENMDAYACLKELAEQGNDIVFATSPLFIHATLKAALGYSNVKFFNCSETQSFKHVNTYFGRIYEPRFLLGMIAGALTNSDILGYVGTLPVPAVICGINSFALGARLVNPRVRVKVAWTLLKNSDGILDDATTQLANEGADYISHQNTLANRNFTRNFGLYSISCNIEKKKSIPNNYIAAPAWNWGIFYERIVRNILKDSFVSLPDLFGADPKLINYWWGMDTGVVDIFYSAKHVPRETQKLVELIKNMIVKGAFHPFTGPIYDQQGTLRIEQAQAAGHTELLKMDWLVDAVESKLPELKDMAGNEFLAELV